MNPVSSPLLTDLYELTMLQAYYERGMTDPAVFELFVRKLPPKRDFLVAAGLEQALDAFPGTVLLVTHDRRMLESVRTTRRWVVEAGRLHEE